MMKKQEATKQQYEYYHETAAQQEAVEPEYTGATVEAIKPVASCEDGVDQVLEAPRNQFYLETLELGDTLSEEDLQIIEKQAEILEEEQKKCVEVSKKKEKPDKFLATLTSCAITGCVVHTIDPSGVTHYRESQLTDPKSRLTQAYNLWKSNGQRSIEIYSRHFVVLGPCGNQVINQ